MSKNKNIESLLSEHSGIQLDIGGGSNPQSGFINIDIRPLDTVDIVHDLEDIPWPLPDECCLRAIASHVVEHIDPARFGFIKFMDEVWRILKPDGQFAISTPYAMSMGYFQDPTHVNPCNEITWAYFDPLAISAYGDGTLFRIYKPKPWRIDHLTYDPAGNMEVLLIKRREDRSYYER